MKWTITYFSDSVFKDIQALPKKLKVRYIALTDRIAEVGSDLGMPHTRAMGDGLFELRVKAEEGVARIFYCTQIKNEIVILHSFIKKTQKTPKNELAKAYKRLKEVKHYG